jgi:GWxTD domain-containing protein
VRRHDPLVEWLALLNRALYWFHPLAWWLCGRLASLAEQACDEAVLARGHDPGKYAELLLELARSVKRGGALVTAWGSSLDGSTLAVRIRRIVTAGRSPALSRTRLVFVTVLCTGAILVPATCELVRAQAAGTAQLDKTAAQYPPSRSDSPDLFDKDAIRDLQRAGKNIGDASGARTPIKADISSESPEQNQETGLKDSYQKWLNEDVVYIITTEEKAVFLALRTDEEREMFIAQFWARREHDPRTGGDQFKKEHYRRLAYANERFATRAGVPGWKTDRGRIYILYGEPDGKESHPSGGAYQREFWESGGAMSVYPFERWHYRHINGIGDDVVIEFVDKNLDGSFVMEKIPVQGAAPQGLQAKGSNIPSPTPLPSENQLPYTVRTDFFRIFTGKARVLVTVGLENKDLRFRRESQTNRAQVNVYGAVTSQTGVPISEFTNTISAEYPDDLLSQGITRQSIWSQSVLLNPGERYRLDLKLMDVNSNRRSSAQYGILVPKFDNDSLQASSVVLASSVRAAPPNSDASGPFVIGDLQVQPNVTSEYVNGQVLIPILQVYNATVDPATGKPALDISFAIKSGNLVLETIDDTTGNRLQIDSNDQVTIVHQIPVRNLTPGQYTLEIKIADRLSNRTLVTGADFHVIRPPS